jgi:predicted  nucleic acid-binding Zn-ribbon protein
MNRLLFDLQEADNLIARLKRERSKLDDGSTLRSERDTLQKALDEEKATLNTLNTQRSDKEAQLQSAEEKITRQQQRLMNATSAHEVNSLERDITALTKARGDLDEAILTFMDEAEQCMGRVAELEQQVAAKTAETAAAEAHFKSETVRLDGEIESGIAERAKVAGELDAESLGKYNTLAPKFHGVAIAHLEKGNCSACGMVVTPFNLREAKSQTWPTCESCGRLLFVEQ